MPARERQEMGAGIRRFNTARGRGSTLPPPCRGFALSNQARRNLAKIEAGLMDTEGRRATAEARDRALAAVVVSLIGLAFLAATLVAQRR
jgi:hypothetical protein